MSQFDKTLLEINRQYLVKELEQTSEPKEIITEVVKQTPKKESKPFKEVISKQSKKPVITESTEEETNE